MKPVSVKEVIDAYLNRFEVDGVWFQDDSSLTVESSSGNLMLIVECEKGMVRLIYIDFNPLSQIEIMIANFVRAGAWETVEITFSPAAWEEFLADAEVFGLNVFDEVGVINMASFSKYWAERVLKSTLLGSGMLTSIVFGSECAQPHILKVQAPPMRMPQRSEEKGGLQLSLF